MANGSGALTGLQAVLQRQGLMLVPIPQDDPHYGKLKGVYVAGVEPGSAAEAGIQQGDIIVSAERMQVGTPADVARMAREQKKGIPLLTQIRRGDSALFVAIG